MTVRFSFVGCLPTFSVLCTVRPGLCRTVGFRGCLGKPFSIEALGAAIQRCCGSEQAPEMQAADSAAQDPGALQWFFM